MICNICGAPAHGVWVREPGSDVEYLTHEICEDCLMFEAEFFIEQEDEEDLLTCKKCDAKVSLLRHDECVHCYTMRTDVVLKLPLETPLVPPIGGWNEATKAAVTIEYDRVKCKGYHRRES